MTWEQRKRAWELRVNGAVTPIEGEPPTQTEALLGWQTNVLDVSLAGQPDITPGVGVTLRYRDLTGGVQVTQYAGELDTVSVNRDPHTVSLRCVGPMVRLSRVLRGSKVDLSGKTDGEAIKYILRECDVPFTASEICDANYVLGKRQPIYWESGTSGMDMITMIDDVFGTATREMPNGKVARWFYEMSPKAARIRKTYTIGETAEAFSLGRDRGGIDAIQSSWEVRGVEFTRNNQPDCIFQPFAKAQERNERMGGSTGVSQFQSDLIQDEELARSVCRRLMRWNNRIPDTIGLEAENDPNVMPGSVIGVVDAMFGIDLPTVKPYLVLSVDRSGTTMTLACQGGDPGIVGTIDSGYDKTCNETYTYDSGLPEDVPPDDPWTDPYEDPALGTTPDLADDPPTMSEDDMMSDYPGTDAVGDCGVETTMGPNSWLYDRDGIWTCVDSPDSYCGTVGVVNAEATAAVSSLNVVDGDYDASTPSPLRTTISGEFYFSDNPDGVPSWAIEMVPIGVEEPGARVWIRSGGDDNPEYGVFMRTEQSEEVAPGLTDTHPGCVDGVVANNGTWNFYQRVPSKGEWHTFSITFWEDVANDFVPRTTVTIDDYTEYVDDTRCESAAWLCSEQHVDGHEYVITGYDSGTRTDLGETTAPISLTDYPVQLRNVTISRMAWTPDVVVEEPPETCIPNPNYQPGPSVPPCGTTNPFCDCPLVEQTLTQLRYTTLAAWKLSVDGLAPLEYHAVASDTAYVNLSSLAPEDDEVWPSPLKGVVAGEFRFGDVASSDRQLCIEFEPVGNATGASVCIYPDDNTLYTTWNYAATMKTETSKTAADVSRVSGDKHPVCPWPATQQTTGQYNFEGVGVTVGDWHKFSVAVDETVQPQRLWLNIDGYTEYVEDVWYENGTCNADASHPGAICSHPDGHRVQMIVTGTGDFGYTEGDGLLTSQGRITPQSGGNTSGTTAENTFNGPYGMATLADGRLVVTDVLNLGFKIFDPANNWYRDANPTWTLATATYPYGVAVIGDYIYVVLQNGKIRKYDSTGAFVTTLTQNITSGRRMAAGPDGYLYVAQADGLNRVAVVDTSGTVIRYIGSSGTGNGQFGTAGPGGIAFDVDGNIYVADQTGKRINVYLPDGTWDKHWGTTGSGVGEFDTPTGLCIRGSTVFVVNRVASDASLSSLQLYALDGTFITQWAGSTTSATGGDPLTTTKFGYPSNVLAVGSTVYVTDGYGGIGTVGRNEVRRFNSDEPTTGTPMISLRNIQVGHASEGTCVRNPEYAPGDTGVTEAWV